jgi:1,2-phenylacetyl-CoA epoxidase catalytic subunit
MWHDHLRDEPRYREALDELWPAAVALLDPELRPELTERTRLSLPSGSEPQGFERGAPSDEFRALWQEMTMVRRSVPGAAW